MLAMVGYIYLGLDGHLADNNRVIKPSFLQWKTALHPFI